MFTLTALLIASACGMDTPVRGLAVVTTELSGQLLAEIYAQETGREVEIHTEQGAEALETIVNGQTDFILLDRGLTSSEKESGLVGTTYALDALALVVSVDVVWSDLTSDELRAMFTSENPTWPDGSPATIFINEPDNASTLLFDQFVLQGEDFSPMACVLTDGQACDAVAVNIGAIAYVPLSETVGIDSVKVLRIDGAGPALGNLRSGAYPLANRFTLVTLAGQTSAFEFSSFATGQSAQRSLAQANLTSVFKQQITSVDEPSNND